MSETTTRPTRADVLSCEDEAQMNAWVAKYVMGHRVTESVPISWDADVIHTYFPVGTLPAYASDWNAAMQVRDKVRAWTPKQETLFYFYLSFLQNDDAPEDGWHPEDEGYQVWMILTPIDICRTALLVTVEEKG